MGGRVKYTPSTTSICEIRRSVNPKTHRKLTLDWHKEISTHHPRIVCKPRGALDLWEARLHVNLEAKPTVHLPTGSSYSGHYNPIGFAGLGKYTYASGAVYEGHFLDGEFHGDGTITFPNGQHLDGQWHHGKLKSSHYRFQDGLYFHSKMKYCQFPDRTFAKEHLDGLNPSGNENLTNKFPTKQLKPNCYDTVDGYYDPSTKIVYKDNGDILRVITKAEEQVIVDNYRVADKKSVGYSPELYEHWTTGKHSDTLNILDKPSNLYKMSDDGSLYSFVLIIENVLPAFKMQEAADIVSTALV